MWDAEAKAAARSGGIKAGGFRQTGAQDFQCLFDPGIQSRRYGGRRQALAGPDEERVPAGLSQTGQGVTGG